MKYVSFNCQSTGNVARKMPVMPPMTNTKMKPAAKYSEAVVTIEPRHSVATQLNTLTPVGTPIRNELSMKNPSTTIGTGEANMWWAHTSVARNAITAVEAAIAL